MSRKHYENGAQGGAASDDQAMELYGIPAALIAKLCEVDISTARKWKRGKCRIPSASLKLLKGDLSAFDPDWKGWTLRNGTLISPEGWSCSPGEILSLPFLRQQIAHFESVRRQTDELEEQPQPGALPAAFGS
jgi:hypothetical protein